MTPLAASEVVFRDIVENSPFAVAMAQDDAFVYVNASAVQLFRAPETDALIGRSAVEFADGMREQRIALYDGTSLDVEVSAGPTMLHGLPARSIILRDVTQRVSLEQRLELVGRAVSDTVWDLDLGTGELWSNRSQTDAETRQSAMDQWRERMHPEDLSRVMGSLRDAIKGGETFWSQAYRFRLNGSFASIVDRAVIVRNANGRAMRVVGAMTDVSELLQAREETATLAKLLEQANRIAGLGRLSATIAHEFNNVLMSIQPHAEIITRKSGEEAVVNRSTAAILQGVQRGKRITEEILRFARPTEPSLAPVAISAWLQRFVQDVRAMNMANVNVEFASQHDGLVLADARQIEQLLWNLVINARDAMPNGGTLSITSGVCSLCPKDCLILPGDELEPFSCIRVSDTGHGIPPEVIGKIFEPLFTTKRNGTGLGLAVAHQIATRHRGYVFAKSEVGKGTTFYVLLRTVATE